MSIFTNDSKIIDQLNKIEGDITVLTTNKIDRDGSIVMTGDFNTGGKAIVNPGPCDGVNINTQHQ